MLLSLQELDKQNNRMRCTTDGLTTVVAMTIRLARGSRVGVVGEACTCRFGRQRALFASLWTV